MSAGPTNPTLVDLIDAQPRGNCLSRAFYCEPTFFELDMERIFRRRWLLVDHASRVPHRGDYFVVDVAGESIVITRDERDEISALFNVCRHRGSRICLENEGHASRLTCPYHSWTYGLDGRLIAARQMPESFRKEHFGLRRCRVEVVEGLIFINMSEHAALDFGHVRSAIEPFLRLHGIAGAKIAARESFRTQANWKLVLENFLECYHCLPTHPEYCAVNSIVKLIGDGSERASAEYLAYWDRWKAAAAESSLASVVASSAMPGGSFDPRNPYSIAQASLRDGRANSTVYAAMRTPINEGFLSMTEDGRPVAPLMGQFTKFDGGKTSVSVDYVGRMTAANDYAALFRFVPVAPEITDFEIIWLVRQDAVAEKDYSVDRLKWLWHVTTAQDKVLAENNQRGVRSGMYAPGPYSLLEDGPSRFTHWYLEQIDPRIENGARS
jgi:Rieske 2Fe-2S family protein